MAKINELNKGISLNIEETFGELKFLRMKEDKKRENDEGELISTQVRYVVQSKRQVSEEIVSIDISADRKEFEFGDQVKLINPRIEYYSFRQGNRTNNYYDRRFIEARKKVGRKWIFHVNKTRDFLLMWLEEQVSQE